MNTLKRIGFLSFGHWDDAYGSRVGTQHTLEAGLRGGRTKWSAVVPFDPVLEVESPGQPRPPGLCKARNCVAIEVCGDERIAEIVIDRVRHRGRAFPRIEGVGFFVHRSADLARRLSGHQQLPDFIAACIETGCDPAWSTAPEAVGPLAMFSEADSQVERPYRERSC
jgi:hypothetical protein